LERNKAGGEEAHVKWDSKAVIGKKTGPSGGRGVDVSSLSPSGWGGINHCEGTIRFTEEIASSFFRRGEGRGTEGKKKHFLLS